MGTLKCANCGKEFEPKTYWQKYCSEKCTHRAGTKRWWRKHKWHPREFDCLYCGKHVVTGIGERKTKFCCEKHGRWYSEKKRAENRKSGGEKP